MTVLKDEKAKWSIELQSFDPKPEKGMTILVEPSAFTPPRQSETPIKCVLLDWEWKIDEERRSSLEISVKEIRQSWIDRHVLKTDESRFKASVLINFALFILIVLTYLTLRDSPGDAWGFVGRHIRPWVGWAIFLLFWLGIPYAMRWPHLEGFGGFFKQSFSLFIGLALVLWWVSFSQVPPGFKGSTADYAHVLADKFAHSYWPPILAALPWAAAVFKVFGLERAEKATSAFVEAGKKRKE